MQHNGFRDEAKFVRDYLDHASCLKTLRGMPTMVLLHILAMVSDHAAKQADDHLMVAFLLKESSFEILVRRML